MKLFGVYGSGLSEHLVSTIAQPFGSFGPPKIVPLATVVGVALIASLLILHDWQERRRHSSTTLDGTRIESLNAANVIRRVNRTLVIEEAENTAIISGRDVVISWRCNGYCRADRESALEFSIDSDNDVPFQQMACFAYDLLRDPKQRRRLQPVLIGPDGPSKKIAVPFLEPLRAEQPFSILLTWSSPNCMQKGIDYYTATFSFDQDLIPRCMMRLLFLTERPSWVRLYVEDFAGSVKFLRELSPASSSGEGAEYRDISGDIGTRSARIYLFQRSPYDMRNDVGQTA